jgi:hypothetical protein
VNLKSRFVTLSPFAFLAIEFHFYEVFLKLLVTKYCIWQRKWRSRLGHGVRGKRASTDRAKQSKNPSLKLSGKNRSFHENRVFESFLMVLAGSRGARRLLNM